MTCRGPILPAGARVGKAVGQRGPEAGYRGFESRQALTSMRHEERLAALTSIQNFPGPA